MTTIHDLLDQYASMARDTREKGHLFERLIRAFLLADPLYSATYDEVWLWQDWPGRDGKADTGIDLVARERYTGDLTAIQCKFFDSSHYLQKSDIDSFFTASGKHPFSGRMIVSTTSHWSKHATDALDGQQIKTWRIGIDDLAESDVDWSQYSLADPDKLDRVKPKTLRPHQLTALTEVSTGFHSADRGKLVMACGTGKTFTSLRIAERIAGPGSSVLFLVPSIALLSQTLKEWSAERELPLRAFAICSDTKVGKSSEDYSVSDLAYPATTSTPQLLKEVAKAQLPDGMTVYFSTYQSIDVVARAQAEGLPEFDLVVCDEAHRTSGFTLANKSGSAFLRIHDETAIRAKKRLYMTATPKIYGEAVRTKAAEKNAVLFSMDDERIFGPVFHRLGFGEAVERDLLTDYRVLVLAVDEGTIGENFQEQFAVAGELNIPDAARIVGIYNGLAKRGVSGLGNTKHERAPLRRAVAFSRSIKDSQKVQSMLDGYNGVFTRPFGVTFRDESAPAADGELRLEAQHVDGTMNVLKRNELLDWLKAPTDPADNVCRILTNARCLSEGVDVPALDAVIFLNSRDSQVDVVQSVGRVMRKADNKDYGYIILPVAVPAGTAPEQALNDNAKYKVVWEVLRALRAHDERFEAKIEQIDLNGRSDDQIQVIDVRDPWNGERPEGAEGGGPDSVAVPMDWSKIGADWREAIYAKIVEKVGERDYWENWAKDVADIANRQQIRIASLVTGAHATLREDFEAFLGGLRDNLNPSITEADAIETLSQHLITQPVFEALFDGYSFSAHNPVSQVMQRMVDALESSRLDTETENLEGFYASVRRSVTGITDAAAKQTTIKRLYEKFFSGAFRNTSERLGIVYTPNEIVDFILKSADDVLRKEFGATLSDEGVHVLDPFTGTGTFIVRLLQSGLIRPDDLERKYRDELHANEIVLLAYYIAAINIEETYHGINGGTYEPFPGIVLTDTFQTSEDDDRYDDHGIFGDNNDRVKAQNSLDIRVIVGNPPYSIGQDSANDNNQNLKYPTLDSRIAATYLAGRSRGGSNSMYDSYVRAIRWASDRIKDKGVVAFVSNGGFLDGNTADGLRKTLVSEFSSLYIFNLRGNARTSGEQRRRERDNVFDSGTRATVAISLLVKNPDAAQQGDLFYQDIGDYLTRKEKLGLVDEYGSVDGVPWRKLEPNEAGDWINQRDLAFSEFTPLGAKHGEDTARSTVFRTYSRGLETGRDAWVYNFSALEVGRNVKHTIASFNSKLVEFESSLQAHPDRDHKAVAPQFFDPDPTKISWTLSLKNRLTARRKIDFDGEAIVTSTYRPFQKQAAYFDRPLNHIVGRLPLVFPTAAQSNFGFYLTGGGAQKPFATLIVGAVPDLNLWGSEGGQFFPRYIYEHRSSEGELDIFAEADEFRRLDNVTDEILVQSRGLYGLDVTKDDIFFFVYGLLHSPDYREMYAADLKKMLPRIPKLANAADFRAFAAAGRKLSALHLDYESARQFQLEEVWSPSASAATEASRLRVKKMRFGGRAGAWDKSSIVFNEYLTLRGIPDEAHEYMLGSRSAIEWILERYQMKIDKASGIMNDPNAWGDERDNPSYILDLLKSIVTVSVETVRIVRALPPLSIATDEPTATEEMIA